LSLKKNRPRSSFKSGKNFLRRKRKSTKGLVLEGEMVEGPGGQSRKTKFFGGAVKVSMHWGP